MDTDRLKIFIEKARKRHGDKYDYSKVEYKDSVTKVKIICPIHGEFEQAPAAHVRGNECPLCARKKQGKRSSLEEFIARATEVHGDKYDHSKVEYVNADTKVKIICPIHGEFEMRPMNHLLGQGCPRCHGMYLTQEDIIKRFREVHGDKYDYSKVVFKKVHEKVKIICPIHGEFEMTPSKHYHRGDGCPKCGKMSASEKLNKNKEWFIQEAKKVHGDKYDYSQVVYKKAQNKVKIICPQHGEFYQKASGHLQGHGCSLCNTSRLEEKVRSLLDDGGIEYIRQCGKETLPWIGRQTLDFYLPNFNTAIECQGTQHFNEVKHFGGKHEFEKIVERDKRKKMLCDKNGVKLLYFGKNIEKCDVINDEIELLNKILDKC